LALTVVEKTTQLARMGVKLRRRIIHIIMVCTKVRKESKRSKRKKR